MRGAEGLRKLLESPGIIVAPGAYDAVSARLVEQAGFDAVYVGSYATSAVRLGLPDAGLVSMREMVDHAGSVVGAVDHIPVIADAENGFGNAATIWRTVNEFEAAGVAGIHIEDHEFGKHLPIRGRVLPKEEMVEKVKAAVAARRNPDFVIIGRTDAGWLKDGGGLEDAIDRAQAYGEAGADMVFLAGISSSDIAPVRDRIGYPICNTESLSLPKTTVAEDERSGIKLLIHYSLLLYAAYRAGRDVLAEFSKTGDAEALLDRYLVEEPEFNKFIGFSKIQDLAVKHNLA